MWQACTAVRSQSIIRVVGVTVGKVRKLLLEIRINIKYTYKCYASMRDGPRVEITLAEAIIWKCNLTASVVRTRWQERILFHALLWRENEDGLASFWIIRINTVSLSLVSPNYVHLLFYSPFCSAALRFSPSKRTRTSIPALKSSSQEILSSQADDRNEDRRDRLGGARSLASLDGTQGTQENKKKYET